MSESISIPLHGRGGIIRDYAVVDATDAEWVGQHRWLMLLVASGKRYAYRSIGRGNGKQLVVLLHREILGLPRGAGRRGAQGDHIDGNSLNNRRANLRVLAGHAENMQNRRKQSGTTSKYRGVSWIKRRRKWRAMVQRDGRSIWGGLYETEEAAAWAAQALRIAHLPFAEPDPLLHLGETA